MLKVSSQRMTMQTWITLVTVVLSIIATFASGAVIVAQLDNNTPAIISTSTAVPSSSSQAENSTSRFQIVVKDYPEDDNRLVAGGASPVVSSNETDTSGLPVTTTKSPSELRINICINDSVWYFGKEFIFPKYQQVGFPFWGWMGIEVFRFQRRLATSCDFRGRLCGQQ